ncbi:IKI3 family-domain-containing protein [Infundibulicybe gibba]|nr:IKI3 family-domain-containing protein [Infundibulicybe gibba]
MRNLTLYSTQKIHFPNGHITCTTIDLETSVIYAASERQDMDDVDIEIWRIQEECGSSSQSIIAMSTTTSLQVPYLSQVISLKMIPDSRKLVTVMRGGDISTISIDEDDATADVEGTVEPGILVASWSPDDALLVLKLILMTSTFDVLCEAPLDVSEFGEDAPINVGWGSKKTQFHGSLGKAAAQTSVDIIGSSPDDDNQPRLSWRGDGAYFVVSSQSTQSPQSPADVSFACTTARARSSLPRKPCWARTSAGVATFGNVITRHKGLGSKWRRRKDGRHDIVFFERNGLRHGGFDLRWGYKVRELSWSSDSNALSVWIEGDDEDIVQVWTTGNYHWYLKHEVLAPESAPGRLGRFTSMAWHPEIALCLILTTPYRMLGTPFVAIEATQRLWDGCTNILLTPFRTQNVPPPMSSFQLSIKPALSLPQSRLCSIHSSFSAERDMAALLWESGYVELWKLETRLGPGRGKVMNPTRAWAGLFGERLSVEYRQIALWAPQSTGDGERSWSPWLRMIEVARNSRLVAADNKFVWQSPDGKLHTYSYEDDRSVPVAQFPEFCLQSQAVLVQFDAPNDPNPSGAQAIASNRARGDISPLRRIAVILRDGVVMPTDWEKRRVERGSRIVVAVPSTMSLILQMPRGNLETINPRPLVLEVVRQDLDNGNYRKAFFACRKHRIDLNVLVDHDEAKFLNNIAVFVDQIEEVDHINLFLTGIGRGSKSPETIGRLCDALREELEKKDLTKYINSILTAFVMKSPPDHEAGLATLLRLRDNHPDLVEDAVKYIIFLVDADRLFDTALGMYDFSLVLMIAQHAQKDPREYLPFLRQLRALDKFYQRFRIDDHLNRHTSALRNLSYAGTERFDEALAYMEHHQLYEAALSVWKGTNHYDAVLVAYGDWLFERRDFRQAASAFIETKAFAKAMVAHEKALEWQELFDIAIRVGMSNENIASTGYRIAEDLTSKKRYSEAARVLLDYAKDVREATVTLVQGNHFSEARRIASLNAEADLLTEVIHPAALESRSQMSDDITEMREQLQKQISRIRELRIKKMEEPDAFYGTEDTNLHNVDVMTDASMPATAFTRYTVAPTTASRTSKRSSRSKRKMERKVGSGRKGTVDEEEYLLKSITKLVGRFSITRDEARNLLPHLLQLSEEHRSEGAELQRELDVFEAELEAVLEEVWAKSVEGEDAASVGDTWASRMEQREKEKQVNPAEKIPRPELLSPGAKDWRMNLFHY